MRWLRELQKACQIESVSPRNARRGRRAALALWAQSSYDALTMEAVADRTGLAIEAGLEQEKVLSVKFNGWRFQGSEDAKIALLEGIVADAR